MASNYQSEIHMLTTPPASKKKALGRKRNDLHRSGCEINRFAAEHARLLNAVSKLPPARPQPGKDREGAAGPMPLGTQMQDEEARLVRFTSGLMPAPPHP